MAGGYLRVRCRSPTVPGSPIRFRSKVRTLEANAASVEAFRDYLEQRPDLVDQVHELLAGCDLACVCEYVYQYTIERSRPTRSRGGDLSATGRRSRC